MQDFWNMDLQALQKHIEEAQSILEQRRKQEAEAWRKKVEEEAALYGYTLVPKADQPSRKAGRRSRTRLTPEDKEEMKKLRASGESAKSIAERYGCSQATVYQATSA